jgi:hypothetical protein
MPAWLCQQPRKQCANAIWYGDDAAKQPDLFGQTYIAGNLNVVKTGDLGAKGFGWAIVKLLQGTHPQDEQAINRRGTRQHHEASNPVEGGIHP